MKIGFFGQLWIHDLNHEFYIGISEKALTRGVPELSQDSDVAYHYFERLPSRPFNGMRAILIISLIFWITRLFMRTWDVMCVVNNSMGEGVKR